MKVEKRKPRRKSKSKYLTVALAAMSAVGVIATAVSSAKATPKALQNIEDAENKKGEELTAREKAVEAAKAYIPTAIIGASTIACTVGIIFLERKRRTSMAGAYTLIAGNYAAYKNKVKELYGQKAHEDILKAMAVEKADKKSIYAPSIFGSANLDFEGADEEERLFYDCFSNRYFQSTISRVLQAEYHLNRNFTLGAEVTLNDFYEFLGIKPTEYGDTVGWCGWNNGECWVDFDHSKAETDDGLECWLIDAIVEPLPLSEENDFV